MAAIWTITNMVTALQADGFTNVVQQVDWVVTDTEEQELHDARRARRPNRHPASTTVAKSIRPVS